MNTIEKLFCVPTRPKLVRDLKEHDVVILAGSGHVIRVSHVDKKLNSTDAQKTDVVWAIIHGYDLVGCEPVTRNCRWDYAVPVATEAVERS